ncbi:hypothetical protein U9M48_036907 [Paspalum notatum var. saurae]|uniref:No apical meristem-associated C-terminal domain-containing protein n=1 Tax=Paspalum notatum var. saurae TaxID=547442 RepID=A0AAQ3UI64_PASNO
MQTASERDIQRPLRPTPNRVSLLHVRKHQARAPQGGRSRWKRRQSGGGAAAVVAIDECWWLVVAAAAVFCGGGDGGGAKLEHAARPVRSGGLEGGGRKEEGRSIRRSREGSGKGAPTTAAEVPPARKRRRSTEDLKDSSDESSTAASCFRPPKRLRSIRHTPQPPANSSYYSTPPTPGNPSSYQQPPPGWNPYMYALQSPPPNWFPPGMQQPAAMCPPQYQAMLSGFDPMAQPTVGDEDDVEVLPTPPAHSGPSTEPRGRTKLSNFNPTEDTYLVKAWLEISCDPVDGFWKRVVERYDVRRCTFPKRTLRSLSSRWATIKAQCSKFAGRYAEAVHENPSGLSDADKITFVAANYAELEGSAFGLMHCWELLKDEPKWRDPTEQNGDGFGEDGSQDSNGVEKDDEKGTGKRPMGRDKAKTNGKKAKSVSGDSTSSDYATRLQDLSLQKISILQEESTRKGERFQHLAAIDEQRYQELRSHNQYVLDIEREKRPPVLDEITLQLNMATLVLEPVACSNKAFSIWIVLIHSCGRTNTNILIDGVSRRAICKNVKSCNTFLKGRKALLATTIAFPGEVSRVRSFHNIHNT